MDILGRYLDHETYYLVLNSFATTKRKNAITFLQGNKQAPGYVLKETPTLPDHLKEDQSEAFEILIEAQKRERPKNIARVKEYSPTDNKVIVEKINLRAAANTSEPLLRNWYDERRPLSQLLTILSDNINGAIFLMKHGLVLRDITLDNLGENLDTGQGILIDLEGLAKEGAEVADPLIKHFPPPPEFGTKAKDGGARSENGKFILHGAQMTYQFGNCLLTLTFIPSQDERYKATTGKLHRLIHKMVEEKPEDRIDLKEANKELLSIIKEVKKVEETM